MRDIFIYPKYPLMKKLTLFLLTLTCTVQCFSQIIFSTHQRAGKTYFDKFNTSTCSRELSSVAIEATPSILNATFGIDENGLIMTTKPTSQLDSVFVQLGELSVNDPLIIPLGTFPLGEMGVSGMIGAVSIGDNKHYISTNTSIYFVDANIGQLIKLQNFASFVEGDLEYLNGFLYAVTPDPFFFLQSSISKIDPLDGTVLDTFRIITPQSDYFEGRPGLGVQWLTDCSDKVLVIPTSYPNANLDPIIPFFFTLMDVANEGELTLACQDSMIVVDRYGGYDAASWETHRQVCEVRLDLDENDDSGRVGPHYRTAPTCTTFFSLADTDVSIWTIDERPVDSVVVYIKDFGPGPEEQYLHYQEDPNFTIVNVNDTLLRVYPTDAGVGYADWGAWLATLQLEVPEPQLGGVRTVETLLYAGGLQADGARSYVNVRPNLPTAGPDRTFYACRSAVIRRERLIGDGLARRPLRAGTGGAQPALPRRGDGYHLPLRFHRLRRIHLYRGAGGLPLRYGRDRHSPARRTTGGRAPP